LGRWFLAQSLVEVGKCDSASTHLLYASQNIDTVKIKAQLILAKCYYSQKDYNLARDVYDRISKDTLLDFNNTRYYATSILNTQDTVKAIELFKSLIKLDSSNASLCNIYEYLGRTFNYGKRYEDAFYFLEKRLNLCNDSSASKISFLAGYVKLMNFVSSTQKDSVNLLSALMYLNKSYSLDSTNLNVLVQMADCYTNLGKQIEAEKFLNLTIEKAGNDTLKNKSSIVNAFLKLSDLKLSTQNFKDLQKITQKWITILPDSEYAWLYNALAFHNLKDIPNACKAYIQVLKLNPNNASAKKNKSSLGC
jgi:tetratricopeptide (TPR) repeat protein